MKFLIDVQLPKKIGIIFSLYSSEVLHCSDIENGLYWTDNELIDFSLENNYILITKDSDFIGYYLSSVNIPKIILIETHTISNNKLYDIIASNVEKIIEILQKNNFAIVQSHKISYLLKD